VLNYITKYSVLSLLYRLFCFRIGMIKPYSC
jgi:hypothetical protein